MTLVHGTNLRAGFVVSRLRRSRGPELHKLTSGPDPDQSRTPATGGSA